MRIDSKALTKLETKHTLKLRVFDFMFGSLRTNFYGIESLLHGYINISNRFRELKDMLLRISQE